MMDILEDQMKTEIWASTEGDEVPYGVCLSINRDLAQNWNEYGDMSKGIALGFSDELMMGIPNDMPHPSRCFEHATADLGGNVKCFIDDNDPQTVKIAYPNSFADMSILQEIRLEIGALAAWTPVKVADITPYAAQLDD